MPEGNEGWAEVWTLIIVAELNSYLYFLKLSCLLLLF